MKLIILASFVAALCSCTEAEKARYNAIDKRHTILLYSGGNMVKMYTSTDVPRFREGGACFFQDAKTKKSVQLSGTFIIVEE